MNKLIVLWALLTAGWAQAIEFPAADDLWLRAAPPGVKMMAAYVTLDNQTDAELSLVGVYAPDFGTAEIHRTVEVDGVFKMREQKSLPLAPQASITMEPGGLHLMLMMPKRSFAIGDEVRICLIYADAAGTEHVQHLDFPVKRQ
ncbi:copper chaperone PCu(A)C [Marinicella meishanensis]|uniref:copper chaperone PCu(A)C n=1 Tax=Marinicella meishanensis TaxID=2873263 RepID=UPI001CBED787|nr:copper chaperone PCu(A)C [Marinicella sp. NBU2979]